MAITLWAMKKIEEGKTDIDKTINHHMPPTKLFKLVIIN